LKEGRDSLLNGLLDILPWCLGPVCTFLATYTKALVVARLGLDFDTTLLDEVV
jgi:hypothetical protein